MKQTLFMALLLAVVLITATAFGLFLQTKYGHDKKIIPLEIEVGPNSGIKLDTDKMYFGKIIPEGSARRTFDITNEFDQRVKIDMMVKGELASWARLDDNGFVLEPGQTKTIAVVMDPPNDIAHGVYQSELEIWIRRYY